MFLRFSLPRRANGGAFFFPLLGGPLNVKSLHVKTGLMLDLLQNSMQIFEDEEMT